MPGKRGAKIRAKSRTGKLKRGAQKPARQSETRSGKPGNRKRTGAKDHSRKTTSTGFTKSHKGMTEVRPRTSKKEVNRQSRSTSKFKKR